MAGAGKETFWRQMVRQWRHSGQSIRVFCRARGLTEASFYAWRRSIAQRDQQADPGPGRGVRPPLFVPVQLSTVTGAPLEVVLERGLVVRVPAGFDASTLRQLLAVLAEAPSC
jgi:transposase